MSQIYIAILLLGAPPVILHPDGLLGLDDARLRALLTSSEQRLFDAGAQYVDNLDFKAASDCYSQLLTVIRSRTVAGFPLCNVEHRLTVAEKLASIPADDVMALCDASNQLTDALVYLYEYGALQAHQRLLGSAHKFDFAFGKNHYSAAHCHLHLLMLQFASKEDAAIDRMVESELKSVDTSAGHGCIVAANAEYLRAVARRLSGANDWDEYMARAHAQRAAIAHQGGDDSAECFFLNPLSQVLLIGGNAQMASWTARQEQRYWEEAYAEIPPRAWSAWSGGSLIRRAMKDEEALADAEKSIQLASDAPERPEWKVQAKLTAALTFDRFGKAREARAMADGALEAAVQRDVKAEIADALYVKATCLLESDPQNAKDLALTAAVTHDDVSGPYSSSVAADMHLLGLSMEREGYLEGARKTLESAKQRYMVVYGASTSVADVCGDLARVLALQGKDVEAAVEMDTCRQIYTSTGIDQPKAKWPQDDGRPDARSSDANGYD